MTILVAADGSFKMPTVDSRMSLKEALSLLGAVRCAAPRRAALAAELRRRACWEQPPGAVLFAWAERAVSGGGGACTAHPCTDIPRCASRCCRADDLLAVEVLWTPEEEVRGLLPSAALLCWNDGTAAVIVLPPAAPPSSLRARCSLAARSCTATTTELMPPCPCFPLLPVFFLQGDYFTVEDLAYDYPTLNTL